MSLPKYASTQHELERKDWHNDAEVRLLARILLGRVFDERDETTDTP